MAKGHKGKQVFMYASCCFCSILTELQFSRQILMKLPHTKFGENPSKGSRTSACEGMCERTDMAKLVFAFPMRACLKWQEMTKW